MFKKKTSQSQFNSVNTNRSIVYDFCLRTSLPGYESYRPAEYTVYHKLEEGEMIPKIDAHLNSLFAGNVDDANGDMLDEMIIGAFREAVPDLRKQRYDHNDTIRRFIVRRTADKEDFCRMRDERIKELEDLQTLYDNIRELRKDLGEVL